MDKDGVRGTAELINQTSGCVEWFTPQFIIEAARQTLGGIIVLDPASSIKANERVKAEWILTKQPYPASPTYSLDVDWSAKQFPSPRSPMTTFLNHPYSRVNN